MPFPHSFRNPDLAQLALTHRSAGKPNNERLEFLGDALLGATVAELLFEAHPKASEGELSRLRAQLVNGQALAVIARELELGDQLKLGPGELKSGGFRRDSILADAFEALVAAVYLDDGYDACRQVVRRLFTPRVAEIKRSSKDAKTRLQEWLQGRGMPLPVYELIDSYGEDHEKIFDVSCAIEEPEPIRVEGRGGSRRSAEQDAAEAVLRRLLEEKT
ncbi:MULTISPECIES: ribonuclease III [unclassified Luteibacter]|uniref:ribonuclease III n=1 Tax=unclassified Luteibacter TaxID=2620188 RepID=UPI0008AE9F5C|nr:MULTISPECIES: ribonuclease III [unclassified Luteibacter]MDR6935422.1 ribonuclease-3 [Luteibacter sp. 3190]SEO75087.1 ribonuclease-3 [Luteibacter sp. UNC138MFCol5.1]SEV95563.1 RNAse III [Luteibacter sp. 329MFSha]